jgi:hypothetical protein
MSQAIGPFCDLKQDVTSWNYTEGAAVAIEMQEYEREREYFLLNLEICCVIFGGVYVFMLSPSLICRNIAKLGALSYFQDMSYRFYLYVIVAEISFIYGNE